DDKRGGAHPVDAVVMPLVVDVQGPVDNNQSDEPDRNVDVEDSAPPGDAEDALLTGTETAESRSADAGRRGGGQTVALVVRARARSDQATHDRQCQGEQAAGADALECAEGSEHVHALG